MQWLVLFKKEVIENWRNFKWVWVPLVFILLSVMDLLSTYYLPQIIDAVGGMPEGAVFEIPETSPAEAIMMSLDQLSMMGTAVIVLMSMGTIASERKSGVAELVLVKPVSYTAYVSAKWTAVLLLAWVSLIAGLLASWYYVILLFGDISFAQITAIIFFFGLWMSLVVSVNIFFSALVRVPGLAAFLSIALLVIMRIMYQIFNHILKWMPNAISSYLGEMLAEGTIPVGLWGAGCITIALIGIFLMASVLVLRNKEMAG